MFNCRSYKVWDPSSPQSILHHDQKIYIRIFPANIRLIQSVFFLSHNIFFLFLIILLSEFLLNFCFYLLSPCNLQNEYCHNCNWIFMTYRTWILGKEYTAGKTGVWTSFVNSPQIDSESCIIKPGDIPLAMHWRASNILIFMFGK